MWGALGWGVVSLLKICRERVGGPEFLFIYFTDKLHWFWCFVFGYIFFLGLWPLVPLAPAPSTPCIYTTRTLPCFAISHVFNLTCSYSTLTFVFIPFIPGPNLSIIFQLLNCCIKLKVPEGPSRLLLLELCIFCLFVTWPYYFLCMSLPYLGDTPPP